MEQSFTNIYKNNLWGTEGSGSGSGSTEAAASGASRIVFHVLMAFHLNAMIDAPCGAMAWQTPLLNHLVHTKPGFRYLGIDVVKHVVQRIPIAFRALGHFTKTFQRVSTQAFLSLSFMQTWQTRATGRCLSGTI